MTEEAAIQADYIDKQYMKTSGAIRFVFEVSKEHAAEAEAVMGLPHPGGNKWCAIAILRKAVEENEKMDDSDLPAYLREEV